MTEKQYQWHKIAEGEAELEMNEQRIAVVEVKGKKICIGRHQETYFGFAHKCPHAGAFLSDGYIDAAGNVVCPLHRYKFSIKNGHNTSGEGYYLKTYPVEQREDGLFIGLSNNGLLNWL